MLNLIELYIKCYFIQFCGPSAVRLIRSKECLTYEGKRRKQWSLEFALCQEKARLNTGVGQQDGHHFIPGRIRGSFALVSVFSSEMQIKCSLLLVGKC